MKLTKSQRNKAINGINKFCETYRKSIGLNKEIIFACEECENILNPIPVDYILGMNRDICILIRQSDYINKINQIQNISYKEEKKLEKLISRFAKTLTECRKNWVKVDEMLTSLIECLE